MVQASGLIKRSEASSLLKVRGLELPWLREAVLYPFPRIFPLAWPTPVDRFQKASSSQYRNNPAALTLLIFDMYLAPF